MRVTSVILTSVKLVVSNHRPYSQIILEKIFSLMSDLEKTFSQIIIPHLKNKKMFSEEICG